MNNTLSTDIKKVEILALIKYYMEQLGLEQLLNKYLRILKYLSFYRMNAVVPI